MRACYGWYDEARLGGIEATFWLCEVTLLYPRPERLVELRIKYGCSSGSRIVVCQYIFLNCRATVW